jgi:hypothetical protein
MASGTPSPSVLLPPASASCSSGRKRSPSSQLYSRSAMRHGLPRIAGQSSDKVQTHGAPWRLAWGSTPPAVGDGENGGQMRIGVISPAPEQHHHATLAPPRSEGMKFNETWSATSLVLSSQYDAPSLSPVQSFSTPVLVHLSWCKAMHSTCLTNC